MADLSQHANYTAAYSGLLDNFYLTLAIAGACLIGYEVEAHVPRKTGKEGPHERIWARIYKAAVRSWHRQKDLGIQHPERRDGRSSSEGLVDNEEKRDPERERLGSRESWEFGYIFQPKAWAVNPSRPLPRWPFMWIAVTLQSRERDMPAKCGLDITLHARFLRGCFFYTLLQTLVIMPILMPLHIFYSPKDIASTSMLRASVSSLVKSSGSKWLWVHALLIWWLTITWTYTILWITWGALAYRQREIKALAAKVRIQKASKREISRGEEGGNENVIEENCEGIKRFRTIMVMNIPPDMRDKEVLRDYFDYYIRRHRAQKQNPLRRQPSGQFIKQVIPIGQNPSYSVDVEPKERSNVDDVVLVRKLARLISLRSRREEVLRNLEIAHTKLAKRVLKVVAKYYKKPELIKSIKDPEKQHRISILVEKLSRFTEERPPQDETVWDALHSIPREYLDPYQELTYVTSFFHKHNAPIIDYLTTKLSYLTMLLSEARSRPLDEYSAASTAFVTFIDAKTARLALKILDSHPKRAFACKAIAAPDWTNILWPRLSKSVYKAEFVRGWAVHIGVWAFTLIWIFPVSLLCALASLTNIAGFVKPLQDFLNNHAKTASVITSLAPVILVALLTLAILMVNGVVFFAIGQSTIKAYLTAFQAKKFYPLPIIASAFPTAAPYFASYILLQVAIQPFFEVFRFGLPTIIYVFGTRRSIIPRQRRSRTEHPTFSHFSQLPQQLLGGAIMHLFALLNPLVIAFTLVYYGACYVVWKRQFIFVYGRLYEVNGRRSSIRILRYSLDALVLAQFVLFAFFILNEAKGHAASTGVLFMLTLVEKLIITRALKKRFDKLDHEEADLLCPPVTPLTHSTHSNSNGSEYASSDEDDNIIDSHRARNDKYRTLRHNLGKWINSWNNRHKFFSFRKSIPFDQTIFHSLDSKIHFDPIPSSNTPPDNYLIAPSYPTPISDNQRIVVPHPPLPPWEDIPPYHRSRGYNDQPAYTEDFDQFLLLQRDPRSVIDLDDCIEMRLSLTSANGGSGRMANWPPSFSDQEDELKDEGRPLTLRSKIEPLSATSHHSNQSDLMPGTSQTWISDRMSHFARRHTDGIAEKYLHPTTSSAIVNDTLDSEIPLNTFSIFSLPTTESPKNLDTPINFEQPSVHSATGSAFSHTKGTETRKSFPVVLGRSLSGRRPSKTSATTANSTKPLTPSFSRSPSVYSSIRKASSMSAQQQALLDEVIEEERLASKNMSEEEAEEINQEKEEFLKEQEKRGEVTTNEGVMGLSRRRPRTGTILSLNSVRSFRRGAMAESTVERQVSTS
nr:hypothetical protein L204_03495 [Cryptococcus depauperatus CBS 7855]